MPAHQQVSHTAKFEQCLADCVWQTAAVVRDLKSAQVCEIQAGSECMPVAKAKAGPIKARSEAEPSLARTPLILESGAFA